MLINRPLYHMKRLSVTIGNPAFCLGLYLTGVHFRGELQHVGDVSEEKVIYFNWFEKQKQKN